VSAIAQANTSELYSNFWASPPPLPLLYVRLLPGLLHEAQLKAHYSLPERKGDLNLGNAFVTSEPILPDADKDWTCVYRALKKTAFRLPRSYIISVLVCCSACPQVERAGRIPREAQILHSFGGHML
jgi:hypothetical protein